MNIELNIELCFPSLNSVTIIGGSAKLQVGEATKATMVQNTKETKD